MESLLGGFLLPLLGVSLSLVLSIVIPVLESVSVFVSVLTADAAA